MDQQFPPVSRPLAEALARMFPDTCPDVATPIDEVRAKAGEQRVVRFLLETLRQQEEGD